MRITDVPSKSLNNTSTSGRHRSNSDDKSREKVRITDVPPKPALTKPLDRDRSKNSGKSATIRDRGSIIKDQKLDKDLKLDRTPTLRDTTIRERTRSRNSDVYGSNDSPRHRHRDRDRHGRFDDDHDHGNLRVVHSSRLHSASCGHSSCRGSSRCIHVVHDHHSHHHHRFSRPYGCWTPWYASHWHSHYGHHHHWRSGFSFSVGFHSGHSSFVVDHHHHYPHHYWHWDDCHWPRYRFYHSYGCYRPVHVVYRPVYVYSGYRYLYDDHDYDYYSRVGSFEPVTNSGSYISGAYGKSNHEFAPIGDGWQLLQDGDAREARREFDREILAYPGDGLPQIGYALSAAMLDRYAEAAAVMRDAMRDDPDSLNEVPLAVANLQEIRDVQDYYELQSRIEPGEINMLFMAAVLRYITGDGSLAFSTIQAAIDRGDNDASAANLRSIIERELDRSAPSSNDAAPIQPQGNVSPPQQFIEPAGAKSPLQF